MQADPLRDAESLIQGINGGSREGKNHLMIKECLYIQEGELVLIFRDNRELKIRKSLVLERWGLLVPPSNTWHTLVAK